MFRLSDCLVKVRPSAPQALMENSAQQVAQRRRRVRALQGTRRRPRLAGRRPRGFAVDNDRVGRSALASGSGPVYPFAVGKTKG